ncbi:MAG: hypothetical protein GY822_11075 [Deltaproteobacteria bacterium]|nr:hypothetical protein [Deltaproteobacteria bacterium]
MRLPRALTLQNITTDVQEIVNSTTIDASQVETLDLAGCQLLTKAILNGANIQGFSQKVAEQSARMGFALEPTNNGNHDE